MSPPDGTRPGAWGPHGRRAAIAITFDNLGEASDLERGRWPSEQPLGRHYSVTHGLPRILALLAEHALPATFFVEAVNTKLYPEALGRIVAAGHELALHGWRHETWAELGPADERRLLEEGIAALGGFGVRPVGFRPPGGVLAPSSLRTLTELGFTYCSPAGTGLGVQAGLAVLPFRWPLIDAFHYLPHFAARRQAVLGAPDPLTPLRLQEGLGRAVRDVIDQGGFLALIFHPFLVDTVRRTRAISAVLTQVAGAVTEEEVWCAPMCAIAAWVREQPGAAWTLQLDSS